MPGFTPNYNIEYPLAGDPIYLGATQMKNLAEDVDSALFGASVPPPSSDLAALRAFMYGGSSRTYAPVCEVGMSSSSVFVPASTDSRAQTGWAATTDTEVSNPMYRMTGGYSTIRIPISGRYEVEFHIASNATSGTSACKIMKNGTTITANSIASDTAVAAGEGTAATARYNGILTAGDLLYWAVWFQNAQSLLQTTFGGIKTKITCRWVGPN